MLIASTAAMRATTRARNDMGVIISQALALGPDGEKSGMSSREYRETAAWRRFHGPPIRPLLDCNRDSHMIRTASRRALLGASASLLSLIAVPAFAQSSATGGASGGAATPPASGAGQVSEI